MKSLVDTALARHEEHSKLPPPPVESKEDAELAKLGVKVTRIPADKIAEMRKAFAEGIWALGEKCCGAAAKKMRALAVKAGLSPE